MTGYSATETPQEHLRNAEQLLHGLLDHLAADLGRDDLVRAAIRHGDQDALNELVNAVNARDRLDPVVLRAALRRIVWARRQLEGTG